MGYPVQDHVDENELDIPMVSGAIGYLSYEYGRERMGIDSMEKDPCPIPEALFTFYDLLIGNSYPSRRMVSINTER